MIEHSMQRNPSAGVGAQRAGGRVAMPVLLLSIVLSWASPASAQKFYPDDPIWREPPPEDTINPQRSVLSGILEFFTNSFTNPGERHPESGVIPAGNANTLGEVPDSLWFTNRHGRNRLTFDELIRGPGDTDPPQTDEPWRVLTVKPYGDRPGMLIADSSDTLYLLRFDRRGYLGLDTAAELVSSKFYWAAGYDVLQGYLVYFERDQLIIGDGAESITSMGELRDLIDEDIDSFLESKARDEGNAYRAVATRVPPGEFLGNYQIYATRTDDPNDIVPHEHRRDLRGLWVLHTWLANVQFTPANTAEWIEQDGATQYIRRGLIDFFRTLGAGDIGPKAAREGNEYRYELNTTLKNVAGMGFWTPGWMRASYPGLPSVGNFEGERFDAEAWVPDVRFVTWDNRLPDDVYWGTKLVMSFTDQDIRAIVDTGGYDDPRATEWISDVLIQRRDKIGRAFLPKVLPLDDFRVEGNRLLFDDLMVRYGFAAPRETEIGWYEFDNESEAMTIIATRETVEAADNSALPSSLSEADDGAYFAARITALDSDSDIVVYLRKRAGSFEVAGIDRNWPGKMIAESEVVEVPDFSRFDSLDDHLKHLLDSPAQAYNETTGRSLTTQQWFDRLSLSERTTFDGVTHALASSDLTDEEGTPLGTAMDLIVGIQRISGQYSGRGGDEQFRLYVDIRPDSEEILQESVEFDFGHENTVYHVGYPKSYRQYGDVPNIQFSVSEDGTRADIDVDYRSSKSPQALFNGHLTSANSDVRAGDNYDRHNGRWVGLTNWWQDLLGTIAPTRDSGVDLLARKVEELPTRLPPDRPLGAAPEELYEAAQEFFTDWLVRGEVDEAMHFFSQRVVACINIDDEAETEILDIVAAIEEMREIMSYALDQLGDRDNLTEAIDGITLETEEQRARQVHHPFDGEFTVIQVRNRVAADFMCSVKRGGDPPPMPGGPDALGTYYGVLLRFKARADQGGVLGFLWDRSEGEWKIVSYDVVEQ